MLLVGFARCVWVVVIVEGKNVEVFNRRSDLVPSARAARRARKTKSRAKRQRGEEEDDRLGGAQKATALRRCRSAASASKTDHFRSSSGDSSKPIAVGCGAAAGEGRPRTERRSLPVALCHPISVGDSRTRLSINQPESSGRCLPRSMFSSRLVASRQVDLRATFRSP